MTIRGTWSVALYTLFPWSAKPVLAEVFTMIGGDDDESVLKPSATPELGKESPQLIVEEREFTVIEVPRTGSLPEPGAVFRGGRVRCVRVNEVHERQVRDRRLAVVPREVPIRHLGSDGRVLHRLRIHHDLMASKRRHDVSPARGVADLDEHLDLADQGTSQELSQRTLVVVPLAEPLVDP